MEINSKKLYKEFRYYMDDTSIPFEDDDNPFPRTKEDDEFDEKMIKKYNLVLKEKELGNQNCIQT